MSRTLLVRVVAGTFALGGVWMAYTQNKQAPAAMAVNKVTDGLYELEQNGNGNVAVYLTEYGADDGVFWSTTSLSGATTTSWPT